MVNGVHASVMQVHVCMVDTGVDLTHPDLVSNLWMNAAEVNGPGATAANGYQNGIDDDGDGAECPSLQVQDATWSKTGCSNLRVQPCTSTCAALLVQPPDTR